MQYSWVFSPVSDVSLIPSAAFDKQGSVVAYPINAVGDGVTDDTAAIKQMFASGARAFDLLGKWYKINIAEGTALASFAGVSGIRVFGRGGGFIDSRSYVSGSLTTIIALDACSDVVLDFNYTGQPIADQNIESPTIGIGYMGATVVNLSNGCSNLKISGSWKHARYGVRSGDYSDPAKGYNSGIRTVLDCYGVGYPVAHYLADDVYLDICADKVHRSAYLAGVVGAWGRVVCRNQYIAPVQVLLTDAKTATNVSRGCQNATLEIIDSGTTRVQQYTWLAGISPSRADPNTKYSGIHLDVRVNATDSIATHVGGFMMNSVVSAYVSGSQNWHASMNFQDIKVSGIVDRSAMASMSYYVFDLFIVAQETDLIQGIYPSVSRLDFVDFRVVSGSGGNPRKLMMYIPGLTDRVNFINCDTTNFGCDFVIAAGKSINYLMTPSINTGAWHP